MTDQKKHTLEADLREAAGWLSLHGPAHAPLRDRLLKWADGQDPNEPDVDLRGLKVGDEVTFEGGAVKEVLYVNRPSPERTDVGVESYRRGMLYHHNGRCVDDAKPNIISYRTPPFDFQRSYDRGVRRFELRHGGITYELHWFKGGGVPFPVRDAYGNQWTASGVHHSTSSNDLIAEAPAEVQQEDAD